MSDQDTLNQILLKVGQIDGKLDTTIKKIDDHLDMDERTHNNLEKRIGYLERWKARIIGIAIGVSAIVGAFGSYIHSSGAGQ